MHRTVSYGTATQKGWERARRHALFQEVRAALTRRSAHLMPFDEVCEKLNLQILVDRGLQRVPLAQITGSVGRYNDFTHAFLPRGPHLEERWKRIEQLVTDGKELPPIELFQVGGAYFVRDGNHRVSVARQHGMVSLRASVWEYETDVPLGPGDDVDEVLCRAAHQKFLQTTQIVALCPDLRIRLTQFVGYQDLLREIATFQQVISVIDGREVALDEAVRLWADLRYRPIVDIIRHQHVLDEFPGRTEADLYLWLCRHLEELESRDGSHVLMEQAADDLARQRAARPLSPRQARLHVRSIAYAALGQLADGWASLRRRLPPWRRSA